MIAPAFDISTDRARLDIELIHDFLSRESYWAAGIPKSVVERSIKHSLPFGAYAEDGAQVGFARVITDYATFGYLADVFVIEAYRGRGVAKLLMEAIIDHPDLAGLRNWTLFTKDAQSLYERFGFSRLTESSGAMRRRLRSPYGKSV